MKTLILDVECTTSNKGNPFDQTNKLVCVGVRFDGQDYIQYFPCSHEDFLYLQGYIDNADIIIGFNIKFDLHWLRNAGITFKDKRIWDCQIGEFLLENQLNPYPSLDQAAEKYRFDKKLDIVKTEYWDKGIDTDQIPKDILSEYLTQDLNLTEQVYLKQVEQFKDNGKLPLFKLQCMDLLVLQEMEYNGIKFDTESAISYAKDLETELKGIYSEMVSTIGNVPFNLNSNDHVSAILYGGNIVITDRIPIGEYKSGAKTGQTRYKLLDKVYTLPRLVEPLKGTETAKSNKEGTQPSWKVSEDVLRSLKLSKEAKKIVTLIDRYGTIEKLMGTYLLGYTKLITTMNWEKDTLHGTLNQCVAVTGRLSSSRPNLQNADPQTKTYMRSRHD